jgi:hypothetical protein
MQGARTTQNDAACRVGSENFGFSILRAARIEVFSGAMATEAADVAM